MVVYLSYLWHRSRSVEVKTCTLIKGSEPRNVSKLSGRFLHAVTTQQPATDATTLKHSSLRLSSHHYLLCALCTLLIFPCFIFCTCFNSMVASRDRRQHATDACSCSWSVCWDQMSWQLTPLGHKVASFLLAMRTVLPFFPSCTSHFKTAPLHVRTVFALLHRSRLLHPSPNNHM